MVSTATRARGRPRAGDPAEISEIALALFVDRGYSATTMAEIADAAGVSLPTLFRYFPSKAALFWYGMEDSARLFREACARQPSGVQLVDAVFGAYVEMLHASTIRLPIIKLRVAIVTQGVEAADAAWLRFEEWSRMVADFVADRRGLPPKSLEADVVGGMIWSALWSALSAWAASEEPDPGPALADVRRHVTVSG